MAGNSHIITGDLDMLLGEDKYLPWSCSRIDTAKTCLYKFYKVYLEGQKEVSTSLSLGSISHEVMALLLHDSDPTIIKAAVYLSQVRPMYESLPDFPEVYAEIQKLLPYMVEFTQKWKKFSIDNNLAKSRIEAAYGITRDLRRASYTGYPGKGLYLRGVIDLWSYDAKNKTLYIIDHKTNKTSVSKNKVKESTQLNLYVAMLSIIYKMPWEKAVIGLNFLRKGKVVWATVTPKETAEFMQTYLNTITHLEMKLFECDNSLIWPASSSFRCKWCSFRNTCETYLSKV